MDKESIEKEDILNDEELSGSQMYAKANNNCAKHWLKESSPCIDMSDYMQVLHIAFNKRYIEVTKDMVQAIARIERLNGETDASQNE